MDKPDDVGLPLILCHANNIKEYTSEDDADFNEQVEGDGKGEKLSLAYGQLIILSLTISSVDKKKQRAMLMKLHLETPFGRADQLANEAAAACIEEVKELMEEKKVEIISHTECYNVELAMIAERHCEELAKRKIVQKNGLTHMTDRHRMKMAKTTKIHNQERSNFEERHGSIGAALSAQRDALKRERERKRSWS